MFWISNVNNHIHNNAAVGGEAGFWAFGHVGVDTPESLTINHPPVNDQGIAEWRNNKASAANDGFRWQFMIKNDHPSGVFTGKSGDESSPRLSRVKTDMSPAFEAGVFKGGLVPVQLTGWKMHHCTQSAAWIVAEKLKVTDSQISDSMKGLLFASKPRLIFKFTLEPNSIHVLIKNH